MFMTIEGSDAKVEIVESRAGKACKVWREGVLIFDGLDWGHALLVPDQCPHTFPDGNRCRMLPAHHRYVKGLAELHGIKG